MSDNFASRYVKRAGVSARLHGQYGCWAVQECWIARDPELGLFSKSFHYVVPTEDARTAREAVAWVSHHRGDNPMLKWMQRFAPNFSL